MSDKRVPEAGDIYSVAGEGLMHVARVDVENGTAWMEGHGPSRPHPFAPKRLLRAVGPGVVGYEQAQARWRGVACKSRECWCREMRKKMTKLDMHRMQVFRTDLEEWDRYRAEQAPAEMLFTDERGQPCWAVRVVGTDFWLGAFSQRARAEAFLAEWRAGR